MIAFLFALLLAAAATPALSLAAMPAPAHPAALEAVTITVSLTSRERGVTSLELPSPDLFFVQIRDAKGKAVYDSRTGHSPIPVHRTVPVPVGTTRLASFDWNGLDDARRALDAPADYVVHVEMETMQTTLVADVPLKLEAPTPIATVRAEHVPASVTIAGTPEREGTTMFLRDASGTVALSRPLGIQPQGRFFVRGRLQRTVDGETFVIERFAVAAENLDPQGTPIPRASGTSR